MARKKLVDDIKRNPAHFYRQPHDVMRDRRFSDAERFQILVAWGQAVGLHDREKVDEALLMVQRQLTK
jgi:hypothetical protein